MLLAVIFGWTDYVSLESFRAHQIGIVKFIQSEYYKRGFQEVVSPNVYNSKLWQTSGHWDHYSENMFKFESEKEVFGLKPMNCPGHCLIFDHGVRSWKELPLRMADFGVLHRNELSGALTGLTRVRSCLLYTSPSPRDRTRSRMPSSA